MLVSRHSCQRRLACHLRGTFADGPCVSVALARSLDQQRGYAMTMPTTTAPTPITRPTAERERPRKAPKPAKPRTVEKRQRGRKG